MKLSHAHAKNSMATIITAVALALMFPSKMPPIPAQPPFPPSHTSTFTRRLPPPVSDRCRPCHRRALRYRAGAPRSQPPDYANAVRPYTAPNYQLLPELTHQHLPDVPAGLQCQHLPDLLVELRRQPQRERRPDLQRSHSPRR